MWGGGRGGGSCTNEPRASRPRLDGFQDLLSTSPSGSMDRPTLDTPTSTPVMMGQSESLLSAGCCSPGGGGGGVGVEEEEGNQTGQCSTAGSKQHFLSDDFWFSSLMLPK